MPPLCHSSNALAHTVIHMMYCKIGFIRPSNFAPWSSIIAHMAIVGAFGSEHGSAWALWSMMKMATHFHRQQVMMDCVFGHLPMFQKPPIPLSKICVAEAFVLQAHSEPWAPITLSLMH